MKLLLYSSIISFFPLWTLLFVIFIRSSLFIFCLLFSKSVQLFCSECVYETELIIPITLSNPIRYVTEATHDNFISIFWNCTTNNNNNNDNRNIFFTLVRFVCISRYYSTQRECVIVLNSKYTVWMYGCVQWGKCCTTVMRIEHFFLAFFFFILYYFSRLRILYVCNVPAAFTWKLSYKNTYKQNSLSQLSFGRQHVKVNFVVVEREKSNLCLYFCFCVLLIAGKIFIIYLFRYSKEWYWKKDRLHVNTKRLQWLFLILIFNFFRLIRIYAHKRGRAKKG